MKRFGLAVFLGLASAAGAWPAHAQTSGQPVTVLELFTSQGCSSCPPADKLLWELSERSDVIVLSEHVDYWDYIGWKDTFASHFFTHRQKAYAGSRADGRIYTPQMVVNGSVNTIGSDKVAIDAVIADQKAKGATPALPVSLSRSGDTVSIDLPKPPAGSPHAEVWVVGVNPMVSVSIARGENQGREAQYRNVARQFVRLGDWNESGTRFSVKRESLPADSRKAVVLVQIVKSGHPGAILGAGMIKLAD